MNRIKYEDRITCHIHRAYLFRLYGEGRIKPSHIPCENKAYYSNTVLVLLEVIFREIEHKFRKIALIDAICY